MSELPQIYSENLTVLVRDDSPMIHCGDSPAYRTIAIELTPEQMQKLNLRSYESISRCIIEPIVTEGKS